MAQDEQSKDFMPKTLFNLASKLAKPNKTIAEGFLRNRHALIIMPDRCEVFYFLCPNCKKTAAVPESFRYSMTCPYCNSEMKAIVTVD